VVDVDIGDVNLVARSSTLAGHVAVAVAVKVHDHDHHYVNAEAGARQALDDSAHAAFRVCQD
jgi:hypothetical protein